jgi:hypothetical protein
MSAEFDFIDRLQARTAFLAIGKSTLRNQGAPGVVRAARKYLRGIKLAEFCVKTPEEFAQVLDKHTEQLKKAFPAGADKSWGGARKALNIFLRDVVYNRPLCEHYKLANLYPWLELPLDSETYKGLKGDTAQRKAMPRKPGVKGLKPDVNEKLQEAAEAIAKRLHVNRVDLDVKYWKKNDLDGLEDNV